MKITPVSLINQLTHPSIINQHIDKLEDELRGTEHHFGKMSTEWAEKIKFPNDLIKLANVTGTPQEILINSVKWRIEKEKELMVEGKYRKLVLSDKSYRNLSNYKHPKEIRIAVLRTLPNRQDIIQLNPDKVIKYKKTDTFLSVYITWWSDNTRTHIEGYFFYIDLLTGLSFYNTYDGIIEDAEFKLEEGVKIISNEDLIGKKLSYEDMVEKYYSQFMVCVTYVELEEVTYDICYSNSKRGHILKGNDLKNESPYNIIQINSNWNRSKLHIGDTYDVMGHYRLAPHGTEGNKYYKYIWIATYEKTGIIKRQAGKEINK